MQLSVKFFFIFLFTFINFEMNAQKWDIHFKTGQSLLFKQFDESALYSRVEKSGDNFGRATSLGLSLKMKQTEYLWFGIEGAWLKSRDFVSRHSYMQDCGEFTERGNYSINQISLFILSEIRLPSSPWLFLNAGGGYSKDYRYGFSSEVKGRFYNCVEWADYDYNGDFSRYQRDSKMGFFAGLGISPKIRKGFYFLSEVRFQYMPYAKNPDKTTFRYHYLTGNLGIGVRF